MLAASAVRGAVTLAPTVKALSHQPAAQDEAGTGLSWAHNSLVDMGDRETPTSGGGRMLGTPSSFYILHVLKGSTLAWLTAVEQIIQPLP